jgi:uncharacterized protein (DUF2147 family)
MHARKILLTLLLASLSFNSFAEKFVADDIVGFWLTKEERAVIEIVKNGEEFEGKLVWLIDIHTGKKKDVLDIQNPDEKLQARSLQGLKNLEGFKFDGEEWNGGEIYDPKKGKNYSANMKLENKNELHLRGYVGIPLFGRTSEWKRQKGALPDKYSKGT